MVHHLVNPKFLRFRTELRRLLKEIWNTERLRLYSLLLFGDLSSEDCIKIENQVKLLDEARFQAPVSCRLCGRQDLDLTFISSLKRWYCESCYNFIKL